MYSTYLVITFVTDVKTPCHGTTEMLYSAMACSDLIQPYQGEHGTMPISYVSFIQVHYPQPGKLAWLGPLLYAIGPMS